MSLIDKKEILELEATAFKMTMEKAKKVSKADDEAAYEMLDFAHTYFVATLMLAPDYFDLDAFLAGLNGLVEKTEKYENYEVRTIKKLTLLEVINLFNKNFQQWSKKL
jgi:predicted component of type VI protein secretion system